MDNPDFKPLVFELRSTSTENLDSQIPDEVVIPAEVKQAVRGLLRHGGHKPSGRGRPASETLLKAWSEGRFPNVHPIVDHFNLLSLKTGIPISVLDADAVVGEWGFRVGEADESYVFNPSGQVMSLKGLLLCFDDEGPMGTPVKDSQRTKIAPESERFLVIIWGTAALPELNDEIRKAVSQVFADALVQTASG